MIKVTKELSGILCADGTQEMLIRVTEDGRTISLLHSDLFIDSRYFVDGNINLYRSKVKSREEKQRLESIRASFQRFYYRVLNICRVSEGYVIIEKEWITTIMNLVDRGIIETQGEWISFSAILEANGQHVVRHTKIQGNRSLYTFIPQYCMTKLVSRPTQEKYDDLYRSMMRFELYRRIICKEMHYAFNIDTINGRDIEEFRSYILSEGDLFNKHQTDYKSIMLIEEKLFPRMKPRPLTNKSSNRAVTVLRQMKGLLAFLRDEVGETTNDPFKTFEIGDVETGKRAYCLTCSELEKIKHHQFEDDSMMSVQRDIFLFQCYSGCRYRDLKKLSKRNLTGNILSYVPERNLKESIPPIPLVELCGDAMLLIGKYEGRDWRSRFFPCVSMVLYERHLKSLFRECGINRMVFVHDSSNRNEVAKPIYEVADSHLAVRTFLNLYFRAKEEPGIDYAMPCESKEGKVSDDILVAAIKLIQ